MPNKEIIEQRLHFLAFDDQTFECLKKIQTILEPKIDHVLDRFYIQLFEEPELKALFPTDERIARARKSQ
jgi:truncated hemoglobin YjbI